MRVRDLMEAQPRSQARKDVPLMKIVVGNPGQLDSLGFIEDIIFDTDLGAHEVEAVITPGRWLCKIPEQTEQIEHN